MGARPFEVSDSRGCSNEDATSIRSLISEALKRIKYLEERVGEVERDLKLIYSIQKRLEECMKKAARSC